MPVFFYIDPDYVNDPFLENTDEITLSYTFFESKYDVKYWISKLSWTIGHHFLSFIFQAWLYSSHLQSIGEKCSPSILMPTTTAASRANICDTWSGQRYWEHNCNQTRDAESNTKKTVSELMFVRSNPIEDGCWAIFSQVDKLPKKCHLLFQNVARKWGVCGCK